MAVLATVRVERAEAHRLAADYGRPALPAPQEKPASREAWAAVRRGLRGEPASRWVTLA